MKSTQIRALKKEKQMPNYEIVNGYCDFRKKQAVFPATYVSKAGAADKLLTSVNDCFSKDATCQQLGCKYAQGSKEPVIQLSK
jgi:hypothetical protein